ncbi:ATP-binding protein (plasmid) [Streptomyces sp. CA-294286]|uniref:ATP-binding protein n=1 Tax=Streptomyces sp. CA-294286 TaxID=3240070 RepID=UPI003D93456F
MDLSVQGAEHELPATRPLAVSAAFEGSEEIAEARALVREFLTSVQAVHGVPVSARAMGMVQLAVSELVTNARKYAPGPCVLSLEIEDGAVLVSVWDSSTALPVALPADPARVGRHGLEIVMALCRTFTVLREPVGKGVSVSLVLADEPCGDVADRRTM